MKSSRWQTQGLTDVFCRQEVSHWSGSRGECGVLSDFFRYPGWILVSETREIVNALVNQTRRLVVRSVRRTFWYEEEEHIERHHVTFMTYWGRQHRWLLQFLHSTPSLLSCLICGTWCFQFWDLKHVLPAELVWKLLNLQTFKLLYLAKSFWKKNISFYLRRIASLMD